MHLQRLLRNEERAAIKAHAYPLSQAVKAAPHVSRLCRQPDPHPLRTIQRPQTRQTNHASVSSAASNACKCLVSNPGSTTRLRPLLSRISIAPPAAGLKKVGRALLSTATRDQIVSRWPRWKGIAAYENIPSMRTVGSGCAYVPKMDR
jgi:hypothetical protein